MRKSENNSFSVSVLIHFRRQLLATSSEVHLTQGTGLLTCTLFERILSYSLHKDAKRVKMTQNQKYDIPSDLQELLVEFTVSCLLEKPSNLVDYAADYFTRLRDQQSSRRLSRRAMSDSDDSMLTDESDEPMPEPPARGYTRRKSVFAEAYDPENDADEGEKVVYPKSDLQRSRLADAVRNILLFRSLDPEQMQDVLDAMFEKTVSAGEYVIKQGDDGDNFYVIESGLYNIYVADNDGQPKLVGNYDNVGSFGELALMYNMPRAATIQAVSSGLLWAMDRPTFRRILLKTAFRKRKMYEQLLESVPMLGTLTSYERMNLADALVSRTYTDGTCIIRQGDPADGMFFVEDGLLRISIVGDNGQEAEVSRVTKGGYFGELALVTHRPRAASVYAIGNVRLA
ncbi:cAMP-dependent protein kinase type II regulatory subunit-like isoform X3 [Artemia franciscana]